MGGSNEQSADGQNNNPDVNRLISAQNLKFDHLTEVLRNTLNAFGQNLGRHLGKLINNKPNNPEHDSTSEHAVKGQRVQASTYEYDADQSTGPHNPEYDRPMPARHRSHNDLCHQNRPEDPSGNRSDRTASDEPEDPDGNRPSEARWWKGSKALKGKDHKGKRYVGPAIVGPVLPNKKSDRYNLEYDDSDRVSIHVASNEESAPEQEADDMHSIIYKSSKISNTEHANDLQVQQLFTTLAKETKKAHAVHEKLKTSLEKVWNRQ